MLSLPARAWQREQVRAEHTAELEAIARFRRVTNYLAAAQIYLKGNALLSEPLKPGHIKDRLLGHWGTCPGINLVYAHLNGYKIANPSIYGTMSDGELLALFTGYGYHVLFAQGDDLDAAFYGALEQAYHEIHSIQQAARYGHPYTRPRWPVILLRSPKGLSGIKELDGQPIEGSYRSHQVPIADPKTNPAHLALLEGWLRSYHVEDLFDGDGSPQADILAQCPVGERRMGGNPHTFGGRVRQPLDLPDIFEYAVPVERGLSLSDHSTLLQQRRAGGEVPERGHQAQSAHFPHLQSRRTGIQ